jgi:trans-aconitate methyltransferase
VYDYLLGGTTNFAADREAGERAASAAGGQNARSDVRANRAFLARAVRYLAGEAQVRQFLDVGTGIPNADNVHAVAQQTAPESRIVYVDHDPIVLAHAHELLRSTPEGATAFIGADLRDPHTILAQAADTLDFTKPVAVVLVAVLHFFADKDDPCSLVQQLLDRLPSGSYLAVSHLTGDFAPEVMAKVVGQLNKSSSTQFVLRSRERFERFFDRLDLIEPGIVQVDHWHPDGESPTCASGWRPSFYAALGRKP